MLPILLKLGTFTIYSYGFFLTLSYLVGTFIFWREGKKRGFNEEKLLDLSLLTLVAALIGGRGLYVILNWSYFASNLKSIFYIWQGGFAYFGSLLFAGITIWYFCRKWKWPFFQIADLAALAASLAFVLGKVGAFLAGTDYGVQTKLFIGITFQNLVGARHPVQLYEAFASFLIFLFLLRTYKRNIEKLGEMASGATFFYWLVLSSLARFVLEYFRADSTYLVGIKLAQVLAFAVACSGLVGLYYFNLRNFRTDLRVFLKRVGSIDEKLRNIRPLGGKTK